MKQIYPHTKFLVVGIQKRRKHFCIVVYDKTYGKKAPNTGAISNDKISRCLSGTNHPAPILFDRYQKMFEDNFDKIGAWTKSKCPKN